MQIVMAVTHVLQKIKFNSGFNFSMQLSNIIDKSIFVAVSIPNTFYHPQRDIYLYKLENIRE
jgi:hypothetical protein